jgi:hypothetical protein
MIKSTPHGGIKNMSKESEFFLKIAIYNSHKENPVFRWLREGNVALGVDVAQQYIDHKIPPNIENQYSIYIRLKSSRPDFNDIVIYEKERKQGNVRKSIEEFDEFIKSKFGFSTQKEVEHALT